MTKPLHKTTIVIWSGFDGEELTLERLAREATSGQAYCSKQSSRKILDPENDPDWDRTEFFYSGEGEDYDGEEA